MYRITNISICDRYRSKETSLGKYMEKQWLTFKTISEIDRAVICITKSLRVYN